MGLFSGLFGGSSDAEDAAKDARRDEEKRQRRISSGTEAINDFFDTGVGVYNVPGKHKIQAGRTYYDARGNPVKGNPGTDQGDIYRQRLKGTAFNDKFFSGLEKDYMSYAKPQLDRQYKSAGEDLTYFLADRGLLDSSTRGNKTSELKKTYETERQGLKETGKGYATQARGSVEDARGDLIAMLSATGDVDAVGAGALGRADALSKPPAYSPLASLFAEFTSGLGTQAQLERGVAYGGPAPRYNTGLFNPRPGAVRNS